MSKLEIGEYVRTKKGFIGKLIEIDLNNNAYYLDCGQCVSPINIVNHRKKRIDLIEVGDYVNGRKIERINDYGEHKRADFNLDFDDCDAVYNDDIKSIVTKEQFKNIEYKVGD